MSCSFRTESLKIWILRADLGLIRGDTKGGVETSLTVPSAAVEMPDDIPWKDLGVAVIRAFL